jgi:hypothetical protein
MLRLDVESAKGCIQTGNGGGRRLGSVMLGAQARVSRMQGVYHYPFAIFAVALVVQCLGAYLGHALHKRGKPAFAAERATFSTILGATLTLLALIIGFSFSMSVSRYDARKTFEAAEATAIGAEYLRADLLPAAATARVRALLVSYTQQRLQWYRVSDPARVAQIQSETARLETELWSAVTGPANAAPDSPTLALAVSGMNDVLNSQSFAAAASRNHIPFGAWLLMLLIAFAGNVLLGAHEKRTRAAILVVLPVVVSVPFLLIADIESPRAGIIRVPPTNLLALAETLKPQP